MASSGPAGGSAGHGTLLHWRIAMRLVSDAVVQLALLQHARNLRSMPQLLSVWLVPVEALSCPATPAAAWWPALAHPHPPASSFPSPVWSINDRCALFYPLCILFLHILDPFPE